MSNKTNAAKAVVCLLLAVLLLSGSLLAQKRVSGKIIGPDSQPIPGVTVVVKGTNVATATALDGSFTIQVPKNESVLIFSSIGFETMEMSTAGTETVNASLKARSEEH